MKVCMNNSRKATLSLTLCSRSNNTDGSVVLANWWPTDNDFMWLRILLRTLIVTDCRAVLSSDYTHSDIGTAFARFTAEMDNSWSQWHLAQLRLDHDLSTSAQKVFNNCICHKMNTFPWTCICKQYLTQPDADLNTLYIWQIPAELSAMLSPSVHSFVQILHSYTDQQLCSVNTLLPVCTPVTHKV